MNKLYMILVVIVLISAANGQVFSQASDKFTNTHEANTLMEVPPLTNDAPAPGKRVRVVAPEYTGTGVYHALYLPTDWTPEGIYPVIVEYAPNVWLSFAGTVEDTHLGFYQSQGNAIWVSMPFINSTTNPYSEAISGWGNIPLAAEYTKTNLIRILENYGGDPSAVFVTGFSRGAIACSYIALRDQAMADIWAGFLPHGQHDGGSYTPDPGNVRLGRIAGRPSIITYGDNDDGLPNCVNGFNILTNLGFPVVSYMLPNLDHTDEWILDTAPPEHLAVREILRQWLVDTIANKPGTHSISGQVTDAFGNAIDHAKVQSGQTHWTFTDSNGYYTLAGLINSDRTLTAQWGEFQSEPRNVTINGMDLAEEDFTLVTHECSEPIQGDINDDCKVDMQDIAIIAINWLKCNRVPADLCY